MILHAEIDGRMVPLSECDWVKWAPCGCPVGVTRAGEGYAVTEQDAWKEFYDRERYADQARRSGYRMELVTHERWSAEIMPLMKASCRHLIEAVASTLRGAGEKPAARKVSGWELTPDRGGVLVNYMAAGAGEADAKHQALTRWTALLSARGWTVTGHGTRKLAWIRVAIPATAEQGKA